MSTDPGNMSSTLVRAALFDIVAVVVFVAIGRRSHDESGNVVVGVVKVAAPFLMALAVAWLVARAWTKPQQLRTGVMVWIVTVALGMVLRNVVFDRGTAVSFIIVATIVLGVFLLGWRLIVARLTARAN